MNLGHLAIFHAVAEAQSVSRGAERLMVSQPAVSKQLRALERSLGVVLFDRTPRGVRLTEAGELLASYSRRIFALEHDAITALEDLKGMGRGRLSIGASTTIGVYLLPELFVKFRQQYPAIDAKLEVSSSLGVLQRLADGAIDVGFIESPAQSDGVSAERFMQDELVAIARPGHPILKRKRLSAKEFCAEPFIVRSTGSDTKSLVEQELARRGLVIKPAMALASTEAIKRAVAAGIGVAIVSRLSIGLELKARTLVVAKVAGLSIRRPLFRVVRRGGKPGIALQKFIETITASDSP
jgi:DNA-binding transcriptional LysR family regulator